MNHWESVDHHAVLRARTLLLGSGTINIHEAVDAYRLLAVVSPAVYLPRLAQALLEYGTADPRNPDTRLAVVTEAASAARRMEAAEPRRGPLLRKALEACEQELTVLGRTEEARAVGEELDRTAAGEEGTR
ncbi:hypothetical protein ACIRD6_00810 [Streptomyces sp. NPDC102473]|uniref:hypothetical protein n=1 Tax=unclassified Streptomyces TaxID=2593676 RepID=UPI0038224491